jgi:hypothetical protein
VATRAGFHPVKLTRLDPVLPPDTLGPALLPVPLEERDGHRPKATSTLNCEFHTNGAAPELRVESGPLRRRALGFGLPAPVGVRRVTEGT